MHEMIYTEMFFQMRVGDTKKKVPLLFLSKNNKRNKNTSRYKIRKAYQSHDLFSFRITISTSSFTQGDNCLLYTSDAADE